MEPSAKTQKLISRACEACKGRKTKCDSRRPKCANCEKRGQECVYPEKGQPGLRPGYGKQVETRLSELEAMIKGIHETLGQLVPARAAPSLADSGVSDLHMMLMNAENNSISDEVSAIDAQLRGDNHRSAISTTHGAESADQQSAHSCHTNEKALDDAGEEEQFPSLHVGSVPGRVPMEDRNILNIDTGALPPAEIMNELAELFFEKAYPCNKLFHKPSFMASLLQPERQVLCYAVTAVAFRFWDKIYPDDTLRNRYVERARDRVTLAIFDSISLISTQALAILALDSFGTSPDSKIVNSMSLLSTAVQHLGLVNCLREENRRSTPVLIRNENTSESAGTTDGEKENKRRLFWVIFMLDRFVGLSTGLKCSLRAENVKQRLPTTDETDWGASPSDDIIRGIGRPNPLVIESTNPWRYLIEILILLDRTHEFLLRPVDLSLPACREEWKREFKELDKDICIWFDCLPAAISQRPAVFDPMWVTIHATYYVVIIRMHSIPAFPPSGFISLGARSVAAARCLQGVQSITALFQSLSDHELDQLGPICAFFLWIASRNLISLCTASPDHRQEVLPEELTTLLNMLRRISYRWQSAQRFVDLLQLVIDTMDSEEGSGSLTIFNDTGRTAHGLYSILGQTATQNSINRLDQVLDWLDIPFIDDMVTFS